MINNKESGLLKDRKPHAALHIPMRLLKGKKIELLIGGAANPNKRLRLLEIGTGSGGIASYFANHSAQPYEVDAVDVVDNRSVIEGYRFHLVHGTELPFEDDCFDVVITNHVIEHVGGYEQQMKHLSEVVRVMKPESVGYLAVPNRWMIVEPHYKLAFLSWLPHSWRSGYLRKMRGVAFYDCEPLELAELEKMMMDSDLVFENRCIDAIKIMQESENSNSLALKISNNLPVCFLKPFVSIIPTLIYTFSKR